MKELKEAGGNTARIYDTINLKSVLDEAEALGLAVVVDIPLPKFYNAPQFYEDEQLFQILKTRVERVVKQHRSHPALLYWNLGNELYYPYFYKNTDFHRNFNKLIDIIHNNDPNHPISTTTIGANKVRVLSIHRKSPRLDFISFNSFGVLSQFSEKLKPISPIWNGPFAITEWGVNGPWEATLTSWKAPIEETSTKKAEQIRERYINYMKPLEEENFLGSFVFYWGKKNEVTPTWYSLFGEKKRKTQGIFELEKIWKNHRLEYPGPEVEYLLLNGRGAFESIILFPDTPAKAKVVLPKEKNQALTYFWEIRKESWAESHISQVLEHSETEIAESEYIFHTPAQEGPYRLFVYLFNDSEYFATANIPFYVLTAKDGE